jgi:hypothetical protein
MGAPNERRQSPRIPERCHVAFRTIREGTAEPKRTAAQTLNLSASGLCLVTRQPLARDDHLAMELSLEGHATPVMAVGRVVWCDRDEDERSYRIGVCFTWLREEDRRALAVIGDHVQSRLRSV